MRRSLTITAAVASLALVAGLAGCSASGSSGSGTLTMWTFKQSEVKALQAVGDAWGKQNNMKFKVTAYTPDDAYATKVKSAARAGSLPDVLALHTGGQENGLAQAGVVDDLTKYFDSNWQNELLPGMASAQQLTQKAIDNSGDDPTTTLKKLKGGHYYGIPALAGTAGVIFARKSVLEKSGVDTSKTPSSWQDWVSQVKKTVSADPTNGGLVTGLQTPETGLFWLYRPMAYAYLGKDAFNGRQSKAADPAWNSESSVATLKLYDQLTPLWSPGVLALGIDQADQTFASGKAAWDVGGTYTLSSLTTFGLSAKDIEIFPVPASTTGKLKNVAYQVSPLISNAIVSKSKHKSQAVSFLKYLSSVKGASTFAKVALDLPATKLPASALSDPLLKQLVGLVATGTGETAFNGNDFSADPAGTIEHINAVALTELPAKTKTPQAVADELVVQYKTAWDSLK